MTLFCMVSTELRAEMSLFPGEVEGPGGAIRVAPEEEAEGNILSMATRTVAASQQHI